MREVHHPPGLHLVGVERKAEQIVQKLSVVQLSGSAGSDQTQTRTQYATEFGNVPTHEQSTQTRRRRMLRLLLVVHKLCVLLVTPRQRQQPSERLRPVDFLVFESNGISDQNVRGTEIFILQVAKRREISPHRRFSNGTARSPHAGAKTAVFLFSAENTVYEQLRFGIHFLSSAPFVNVCKRRTAMAPGQHLP